MLSDRNTGVEPIRRGARITVLDGIRGVAIALVIIHHSFQWFEPNDTLLDRLSFSLARSGWCGVDLFFVLSGFLITGILYDTKARRHYLRNFYARRMMRIFPLYYGMLLVFFYFLPTVPHPLARDYVADSAPDRLWFVTYLTNFRIAGRGEWYHHLVPNVFWSLAIEEQFYLVWPLIVLLFRRETLMAFCVALCVLGLVIGLMLALFGVDPIVGFVSTPTRGVGLAAGSLVALMARGTGGLASAIPWARRSAGVATLILAWLSLRGGGLEWNDSITNALAPLVLAILFGALIILCVNAKSGSVWQAVLDTAPLRILGKYSFAMYLFHGPVGSFIKQLYTPGEGDQLGDSKFFGVFTYMLIVTTATLLASWLSWQLMEKHVLRLKDLKFGRSATGVGPPRGPGLATSEPTTPAHTRSGLSADRVPESRG